MKARYRYRFYPTTEQQSKLSRLFGCCRVVWNDALAFCRDSENLPKNGNLQKQFITQAKQSEERQWLGEVSNIPLQQSIADLGVAYGNFFASLKGKRKGIKVKPPKFKKRSGKQTARFRRGGFVLREHKVYLAKIGDVKVQWSRELPSDPSSVTVIKDCAGRYFLSFVVETQAVDIPAINDGVGIDLGIATFATFSDGQKVDAPKPLKKHLRKLRKAQRSLSRKQKGSKRRERARLKVAKIHAKITDTRSDFLHKLSTKVARENQSVALEDLNVSGMVKNRKLSRAISDLGWRQFRTLLEAKCSKYQRDFIVISRWEPTSQVCSCCGFRGGKLDLSVREWQCLNCETIHDRDVNAAVNIKVAGGHSETLNGRGGKRKSTSVVAPNEASTYRKTIQLNLFVS
ncbi:MAG: RNA-guided endonuclease InsQ/TnpB family protein [Microcystaceae cyanobacterium]